MRRRSSLAKALSSDSTSCYTGDGANSSMSMDLDHGGVEFVQSRETAFRSEEEPAVDELPEEIVDPEFYGINTTSPHRCHHKMHPARKVAFVYAATGRRFLGCPLQGAERCRWFLWIKIFGIDPLTKLSGATRG